MDCRVHKATHGELILATLASENKVKIGSYWYTPVKLHSRAKMGSDAAYLSNFTPMLPGKELLIDGEKYISVEHYFQAQKFKKEHRAPFQKEGSLDSAKKAKSAGCRGGMKKLLKKKLKVKEYSLNLSEWNGPSDENVEDYKCIRIMKRALWARFCQDKRFREIVTKPFTIFEHYEKPRGKPGKIPVWGCYFSAKMAKKWGMNVMGVLLNELAFYHNTEKYFQYVVEGKKYLNWSGYNAPPLHPGLPVRMMYPRCTEHHKVWRECGFMPQPQVLMPIHAIHQIHY